jgi:hypothetical protein
MSLPNVRLKCDVTKESHEFRRRAGRRCYVIEMSKYKINFLRINSGLSLAILFTSGCTWPNLVAGDQIAWVE